MSEQKSNPVIDALFAAFTGAIIKEIPALSEKAIHAIFHKHKKAIVNAAVPVTEEVAKAASGCNCQPGEICDPRTNKCITDPGV